MARLYVVNDGDMAKNKNLLAFKLGENDFLPVEFINHKIVPYLEKRGPLPEAKKLAYSLSEEHAKVLEDGIPVLISYLRGMI
jgi:hypothetical protein